MDWLIIRDMTIMAAVGLLSLFTIIVTLAIVGKLVEVLFSKLTSKSLVRSIFGDDASVNNVVALAMIGFAATFFSISAIGVVIGGLIHTGHTVLAILSETS
jgi:hypothetical protein